MAGDSPKKLFSQLLHEDPDLRDIVEEFVRGLPGRRGAGGAGKGWLSGG